MKRTPGLMMVHFVVMSAVFVTIWVPFQWLCDRTSTPFWARCVLSGLLGFHGAHFADWVCKKLRRLRDTRRWCIHTQLQSEPKHTATKFHGTMEEAQALGNRLAASRAKDGDVAMCIVHTDDGEPPEASLN